MIGNYLKITLCQKCQIPFQQQNSRISLLPNCTHTVCLPCLSSVSKQQQSYYACPFCKVSVKVVFKQAEKSQENQLIAENFDDQKSLNQLNEIEQELNEVFDHGLEIQQSFRRFILPYYKQFYKYMKVYNQVSKQRMLRYAEEQFFKRFNGLEKLFPRGQKLALEQAAYFIEKYYQIENQIKQIRILEDRFIKRPNQELREEILQKTSNYVQELDKLTMEERSQEIDTLKCNIDFIIEEVLTQTLGIVQRKRREQVNKTSGSEITTINQYDQRTIIVDHSKPKEANNYNLDQADKIKKAIILIPKSSSPVEIIISIDDILKERFKKITEIDLNLSFFPIIEALELIRGIQIQSSFKNIRKLRLTLPLQYYDHALQTLNFDKHIDLLFEISDLQIEFVNFDYPIHNYQEISELPTNYSLPFALTLNLCQNKEVRMEELKKLVKQFKLLPIYRLKVNIQGCNIDEVEFKQFLRENSGKKKGGPALKMYLVHE